MKPSLLSLCIASCLLVAWLPIASPAFYKIILRFRSNGVKQDAIQSDYQASLLVLSTQTDTVKRLLNKREQIQTGSFDKGKASLTPQSRKTWNSKTWNSMIPFSLGSSTSSSLSTMVSERSLRSALI